jgi:hypothetical protein
MAEITHQEYKDALQIVNAYIRQVEKDLDKLEEHLKDIKKERKVSTTPIKAPDIEDDLDETIFITKYCVTVRLRNAIYEYYFNHNLLNEDKTMLIENLKYVDKKQFNELRNIGKKTFTELEDFAEYNNIKLL